MLLPAVGLTLALKSVNAAGSLALGTVTMALILWTWQISSKYMIREDPPAWTPLLIVLRYGLIGIAFYAIIHRRLVAWEWFVCGSVLVLAAITLTTVFEILRK